MEAEALMLEKTNALETEKQEISIELKIVEQDAEEEKQNFKTKLIEKEKEISKIQEQFEQKL